MVSTIKQEVKHQKLTYKNKFIFYLTLLLIIALGMFVTPTITYATDEYDLYFIIENFNWEEFIDGSSALEESGPLYGLGFTAKLGGEIPNPIAFKFKGELFGGNVDYDGQTQGGIPASLDTDYTGFKAEIDIGWQIFIRESSSSIEPFLGLGGEMVDKRHK